MTTAKPHKRTRFLINPSFQLSFIKHSVFLALLTLAIFYSANLYHFWEFKNKGLNAGLSSDHVFFEFLNQQQRAMDYTFVAIAALAFVIIAAYGLFLSHRVAGPIYRLTQYLKNFKAETETKPLKFREDDYFADLAEAVNTCLQKDSSRD
jgi:sensor histidine kinase YesM